MHPKLLALENEMKEANIKWMSVMIENPGDPSGPRYDKLVEKHTAMLGEYNRKLEEYINEIQKLQRLGTRAMKSMSCDEVRALLKKYPVKGRPLQTDIGYGIPQTISFDDLMNKESHATPEEAIIAERVAEIKKNMTKEQFA